MLKIRLQGTTNELKWFRKILERNSNFEILSISEPYANKGTNKYFRVYVDVERIRPVSYTHLASSGKAAGGPAGRHL